MAKAGELDWSNLYKTGKIDLEPIHDTRLAELRKMEVKKDYHKTGEKPSEEMLRKEAEWILDGWRNSAEGQWRDEDHAHKEVVTQEQAEKMQKNWENVFQNFYEAGFEPINKSNQNEDWGTGKSFNDSLTEKERLRRNMHTERDHSSPPF